MRNEILLVAALLAAPTLVAQEKGADAAAQMPNPKTPQHDALDTLAGDWEFTFKMAAMPGVPGMDKPMESTGTEHAELVCNGLWLESVVNSTMNGKPFQGISLGGYDKFNNKYVRLWIDSEAPESCTSEGSYDAKTRTFSFKGKSAHGDLRNSLVFKDHDHSVETCWMTGPDGKEVQCMEISRKRAARPAPPIAANAAMKAPAKELELLYEGLGNWNATIKMAASAGHKASEEKGTEKAIPVCNGNWVWCDFKGTLMGSPFEGHGITGYDTAEKKYVSYWIDTTMCTLMKTSGTCDAAKKTCTLDGKCADGEGKPMTVHQVATWPDANTRNLHMEFKGAQGTEVMDITYHKAAAKN